MAQTLGDCDSTNSYPSRWEHEMIYCGVLLRRHCAAGFRLRISCVSVDAFVGSGAVRSVSCRVVSRGTREDTSPTNKPATSAADELTPGGTCPRVFVNSIAFVHTGPGRPASTSRFASLSGRWSLGKQTPRQALVVGCFLPSIRPRLPCSTLPVGAALKSFGPRVCSQAISSAPGTTP